MHFNQNVCKVTNKNIVVIDIVLINMTNRFLNIE